MYALGKFPELSNVACKSKWSWSTIMFYSGTTASCHRCDKEVIDPLKFDEFHNTPQKQQQRRMMLDNTWPGAGCEFCRDVEEVGGTSDRMVQSKIPTFPAELVNNITTVTTPTTVEVYFDNKCNLACVYCHASFSSRILNENKKFGKFPNDLINHEFPTKDKNIEENKKSFWKWMKTHSENVEHFNILGGEPFIQDDFDDCLTFFNNNPRPYLTITVVSNLTIVHSRFKTYIDRLHQLVIDKKVRRIDITASIDCWGKGQEYIRYGVDLALFERNIEYLLIQGPWLRVNINQTITNLSLPSTPALVRKINKWRESKDIGHYGGTVVFNKHLDSIIFESGYWNDTFAEIFDLLKDNTYNEKTAYDIFSGVYKKLSKTHNTDKKQIKNLFVYLDENDRRRGTDWRDVFPHLLEFK